LNGTCPVTLPTKNIAGYRSRFGTGKRGGVRIIYAAHEAHEIWLLTIYGKSDIADIPAPLLRAIKHEMEHD
jgi:mRNA-degrading endonuclease RelE of RelBE toxin-antitoxin system